MFLILTYSAVFLLTYAGVEIVRRLSWRWKIVALPNERSLHNVPIPQGGGLAIVAVYLAFYLASVFVGKLEFSWSYFFGAVLIVIISWLDDVFSISFIWRFIVHSIAALAVVGVLGYFQEIDNPYWGKLNLGVIGPVLTFFWIVWLTNAYNFMDGIDGLAGIQAVTAGFGWLIAGYILGVGDTGFLGGLLAFSGLGFLIINWQPAKIFMGDVGSAFLGYNFAVLPLLASKERNDIQVSLVITAIVVVWLFLWDTYFTLVKRIILGEKIWQAHRGHIYQRFVTRGLSHQKVALGYGFASLINVIILTLWLSYSLSGFILLPVLAAESLALLLILKFYALGKAS